MSMKLFCDWCDKEINQHVNERVDLNLTSTYQKDRLENVVLCRVCGDLAINALDVTRLACRLDQTTRKA